MGNTKSKIVDMGGTKKKREAMKADGVQHIADALETFGYTHAELGRDMGVGGSTISTWLSHGYAPAWSVLAVEALMGRNGGKVVKKPQVKHFIVSVPPGKEEFFLESCGMMKASAKELTI